MSRLRSTIFWCHLIVAAFVGVIVAVMSVTGVALAYQRQVQYWADTRHFQAAPPSEGAAPSLAAGVDAVRRATSAVPTTLTIRRDAGDPLAITAGGRTLYVNPYTAQVYGEGEGAAWRAFFSTMVGWHRWLTTGTDRTTGRAITGACNLGFLFLVLSGFYLWWPSALTWPRVKNVLLFRRRLPAKARDFNWHHVIGFWSAIPLAVIVSAGVVMSYPWANALVYRTFGEAVPAPAARARASAPGLSGSADGMGESTVSPDVLTAAVTQAAAVRPDWQILTIRLADRADAPLSVTVDAGNGGQPQRRGTLTLSAAGELANWEPFTSQTPGRRARSWLRFLHTGEALGLAGQTIAAVVSGGAVVLVYTGFALAIRRLKARITRRPDDKVRSPRRQQAA
jgi:uncharacterized iron-regulated membrane protein